jgi:hypothetical protein
MFMKNAPFKLALLALLLGGTAGATTAARNFDTRTWGKLPSGQYTEVTGQQEDLDYECNPGGIVCTEMYDSRVNPNDQQHDEYDGTALPISTVPGTFSN